MTRFVSPKKCYEDANDTTEIKTAKESTNDPIKIKTVTKDETGTIKIKTLIDKISFLNSSCSVTNNREEN